MTDIPGITERVPVYADTCLDCGKPVRRMTGLSRPGAGAVFWHAAPKPAENDPRRAPRRESWKKAISDGMVAANERRRQARGGTK